MANVYFCDMCGVPCGERRGGWMDVGCNSDSRGCREIDLCVECAKRLLDSLIKTRSTSRKAIYTRLGGGSASAKGEDDEVPDR